MTTRRAARRLYDLALEYQERSQRTRGAPARRLRGRRGDRIERRRRPRDRRRRRRAARPHAATASSAPRSSPRTPKASGGSLTGPEELVEFYDPTDVFGDLADALAEAYPVGRAGAAGDGRRRGAAATPRTADTDAEDGDEADADDGEDDDGEDEDDDEDGSEGRPTA